MFREGLHEVTTLHCIYMYCKICNSALSIHTCLLLKYMYVNHIKTKFEYMICVWMSLCADSVHDMCVYLCVSTYVHLYIHVCVCVCLQTHIYM